MAISLPLRKKLAAAAGAGSVALVVALLGGQDGIEGRRYNAYQDITGIWTVCDGHTGADIVKNKKYSDSECDALLRQDLLPARRAVDSLVTVPLSDYQRAALYSFVYNAGERSFAQSALLRKLNAGDRKGACDELRRWVYAGGVKWHGLENRREMERVLCMAESVHDI